MIECSHIAAGGNRHPSAADWAPGLLAFGAGKNLALWNPNDSSHRGIYALLPGHNDVVNAVKIYENFGERSIITGSADNSIRIWTRGGEDSTFKQAQCLTDHQGSVNAISILPAVHMFATGAADGTVKVWNFLGAEAKLLQSISLQPYYIPLTISLCELDSGAVVVAIAGTSNAIQLYVRREEEESFELQTTLSGHEGWIRSLDFATPSTHPSGDVILASASQDKYIRLWKFREVAAASEDRSLAKKMKKSLTNKEHLVGGAIKYNVTFEALLIGHEDWIHTVRWSPERGRASGPRLLSTSADNSLAIWEADEGSGVWVCQTRLGEISSQKGSTTATGSTGGFWIGLWEPNGKEAVSLDRTGSWRRWKCDREGDIWQQQLGISGHTQEVKDVAWASDGSYMISTGSDQTTRLYAEWKREKVSSWHEFSRPQIHGYDLNCITSLTPSQFVSGADEKLLRVFNKPRAIDRLLSKLCGATEEANGQLPDAANIPVLGLSNKAIVTTSEEDHKVNGSAQEDMNGHGVEEVPSAANRLPLDLDQPPFEEHLARSTLWPEHEKLYGHGYEICAVAATHDGSLIATACKASSIEHAVIRIYETVEWREIKPPLSAHNLTVTALAFSSDSQYLLSVGRDRQWTVFTRQVEDPRSFRMMACNAKGHSRMILDCSWAPKTSQNHCIFATAGRDKMVKIWKQTTPEQFECVTTISAGAAVTAVAFDNVLVEGKLTLAYGTEDGDIHLASLSSLSLEVDSSHTVPAELSPAGAVNALRWRPHGPANTSNGNVLAAASDDASLRLFRIQR